MPALPSASITSRRVSARAGWLASNLTARLSSRGAAGRAAPPSMSRSTLPSCARASPSTGPPLPRCCCTRARSARRLSSSMAGKLLSGAAAKRQAAAGGGRIPADQFFPGELLAETLALLGELQPLGGERHHVGLAVDFDLALEQLVEFGSHSCPLRCVSHAVDGNSKPPPTRDGRPASQKSYLISPSDFSASTTCGRACTRST